MEKVINGYDGYTITADGKIISSKTGQKRVLKPRKNERGYLYVNLCKEGTYKTHKVHILVAKAFVPNPQGLTQVNHIDGNKENNNAKNLEWCTQSQNLRHAFRIGLMKPLRKGEKSEFAKLTEREVREIRLKYIPRVYTIEMLAKEYGVSKDNISQIVRRVTWKHI